MQPDIVSRDQWLSARKALLAREREVTHLRDQVAAQRRALPWVKVDTPYVFETPDGPRELADLFQGRSQLFVQHFMLTPGSDHICPGCSIMADSVDGARQHFEQADLSFVAIARAPLAEIEPVRRRMGWTFPWVSSAGTSFNYDFGVSFTPEQIEAGVPLYNYGTTPYLEEDVHGTSVFARNEAGDVFHTYSTFARGDEAFISAFAFLDMTPKGRNEEGTMSWVRLHDEYDAAQHKEACCG
ncbi:DUF899 domain-containing protein [Pyruvatibacter mobilis]|uniref:DUF899 domain-containing protein n=1 Tax=Pyruvatibacter mobilis TaxID=1712261 RepID=UPI003BAA57BE